MGASWHQLCAAVDEKPGVPLEAFAARAEAVPEGQRIAPRRWALALLAGAAPRGLHLCRTLIFAGDPVPPERLVAIATSPLLRHLTELRLIDAGIDDRGAQAFAAACELERLRALYLGWNAITVTGLAALLRAPALAQLATLHLYKNRLGPEGMRCLAEAAPALEHLNVCFNGLGPEGARALAASRRLAPKTLHIGINALTDEGLEALARWPGLRRVTELNARANGLSAASVAGLSRGPAWGSLEQLLVEDNPLGAEGAEALAAAGPAPLRKLQLGDADIGDDGARVLAGAPTLRGLRELTLWNNDLGDDGVEALVSAPFAGQLEHLDLSQNHYGERGERLLAALRVRR